MKSNYNKERMYSEAELKVMIEKMSAISSNFYPAATRVGNHAFIEFCGLMNEYIAMCRLTVERGQDFTMANVHTGQMLQANAHHIKYLAEKFECIYGPLLQDENNKKVFFEAMGWTKQE